MRLSLIVATSALVFSGGAHAADLPSRRLPPPALAALPIPAFTWSGFYFGAQVGYDFGSDNASLFPGGSPSASVGDKGVIGGGHIGYLQSATVESPFGGVFQGVYGFEGDVDAASGKPVYALGAISVTERQSVQGSVRGRFGVAIDRTLLYTTAGAAFGGRRETYTSVTGASDAIDRTRIGYTVGGGIEYALTNKLTLRTEYRYTDFGHYNALLVNAGAGRLSAQQHISDSRVQAGFSYFYDFASFPPAVVARY